MKTTERKVIKIQGAGRKNVKSHSTTARVCAYKRYIILLDRKVDKTNISNYI